MGVRSSEAGEVVVVQVDHGADERAHPVPSERARALVAGAYDTHVHVAPDVMRRRVDDLTLARHCSEVGLAGFVLKSHYVPTAERAETHPEFTSQRLPVAAQTALAERGALLERCFTTPHTGKVSWEVLADHIRRAGPEHSVLSSDLGQPFNPPVEDGLALLADKLLTLGFDEDEIRLMAVTNTRKLAAPA